jgi:N-acetylglucosaminyldiphosphoundecaprenol N-acetyl-beta-D-mannosaminyltransferase
MQQCLLFNLRFDAISLGEAVDLVLERARNRQKGLVVTPNADHIVLMKADPAMKQIYSDAVAVFADGMPLVFLSRFTVKTRIPERVTGSDLLPAVCKGATQTGARIFLLGGNPGAAKEAARRLLESNPGLKITGYYCPPFGFESDDGESEKIINLVNRCEPDILIMGVGTPKQEKWAYRHLDKLCVGPILCIGAAIDFAAGNVQRCPRRLGELGLEWAWRLASQPRRLWRRYLLRGPRFVKLALRELYDARFQTPPLVSPPDTL